MTPYINRLRQQLAHECPELATRAAGRDWLAPPPGLWRAIAGDASQKWRKEIEASKGLGLSQFSRELAAQIVAGELSLQRIEAELEVILKASEFEVYLRAMEPFHFGRRTAVALLGAIYPLEKFAGHHNPLGAFKLSCGMAQVWQESGKIQGWQPGGSKDIRMAMWRWAYMIVTQRRVTSPELELLRDYYQNGTDVIEREGDREVVKHLDPGKGNQRLMRVSRRALTMLYRKLKSDLR